MTTITKSKKTTQLQTIVPTSTLTMSSAHSKCSLYLHPEHVTFNITNNSTFVETLQTIGLISHPINQQQIKNRYFTGDKYLDYIAYLGCAPNIQLEASHDSDDQDSNDFCHIRIHQHKTTQLIYNQKQLNAPHCPNCKKSVKGWQHKKTATTITCNQCDTTSNIETFNWRKMAGYAQLFVEITDIFPKEAIPHQLLLDKLANITNVKWRYFYGCQ